jgi:AcrR family transcriptional regulator
MARKTKAESEATRELLLDAAEQAFLDNGVACTSLDAIARRAGHTRGAIYWHFEDKSALFQAMLDRVRLPLGDLIEEFARESGEDPVKTLRRLCAFALQRLVDDPRHRRVYTILLLRCELVGAMNPAVESQERLVEEVLDLFERQFSRASELGHLNPVIPPAVAASALHAYMSGLFMQYLRDPQHCDLENHRDALLAAFFDWVAG